MSFVDIVLSRRQRNARGISLPRRQTYHASPPDWRNEVLYFLLPDRFSDGQESTRPLVNRRTLGEARRLPGGEPWRWDRWAKSGAARWQGGTINGIASQLDYLKNLGISALWIGPIFKQRGHLNTYHGYGIQDFLDVDPRFGNRRDLVDLVASAHAKGIRVILDIIFNHSGSNWLYQEGTTGGKHEPVYTTGRHQFGGWRNSKGNDDELLRTGPFESMDDGVYPEELQNPDIYTRAGAGDLGAGDIDDPNAEHKRSDFLDLRDFRLGAPGVLSDLARCYKYWIALTDCDGFRMDTLKHVSFEEARNFCGTIKEFAANLGKDDFFLIGEIAGGDFNEDRYLDVLGRNLNAALDIGQMRLNLSSVAKGLAPPAEFFDGFDPGKAVMGSHRNVGRHHVSILDDHDHVFGPKIRFSSEVASDHQVVAGVVLQLFTLGIPCIYYGTEQALSGPEFSERQFLPEWKSSDRYLREAMFGPSHPRSDAGTESDGALDLDLPGFGPFGTSGHHCFDQNNHTYRRIAAIAALRQQFPVLRSGRQYPRPISFLGKPFGVYGPGEIIAWSRILDDEEAVCILNAHGVDGRGADVLVDAELNAAGSFLTVVLNTAQVADPGDAGSHPVGSTIPVQRDADGRSYIEVRNVQASEAIVLTNHP